MAATCVTVDQCKSWEKSGKSEFIRLCKKKVSTDGELFLGELKRVLYELCCHAVKGRVKIDGTVTALSEVVDMHSGVSSLLADIFGILDAETMCNAENLESTEDKQHRERFLDMVTQCSNLITVALLKERLDAESLESVGILQTKQLFQGKYVKTKTRLYYKQQKFNLLREESEGYSKLITELLQDYNVNVSYLKAIDNIRSLIGGFNLDPNRVLDIVLEGFECRPDQDEFFVPLLQAYTTDKETVCHILGFKYHFYQKTDDSITPTSLYRVTALLLYHRLIDLETLYPHLCPTDSDVVEAYKREIVEAKSYARKLAVVQLSEKSKDEKDDKEGKVNQHNDNQKVGLIEALLLIGNWEHARQLMDKLPPYYVISHPPVAKAMCSLIHYLLDPLYEKQSGLPSQLMKRRIKPQNADNKCLPQVNTFTEMKDYVFPMLRYLGPHLYCDSGLLVKLLRLAKTFVPIKDKVDNAIQLGQNEEVFRCFMTATDECILPSLSLLPANCCMSEEVWSYLKLLKYEYRYRLYGQWKNESHQNHPKLMMARADIIDKAKYIMKRLAKENVKPLGRQIGKLSHSNPGALFEYILNQIQKFDNFIGPVVDSLKFLTSLSYDMLAYCIIEALANPDRERMKHDDTNISLWLQSLANFSGAVFKKYQIELGGLLQYVTNQLKAGKSYDLLLLREVIQRMAGIEVSEEITDDQLAAMSGGDLLKQEGGQYFQVRNTKKSSGRLKETLLDNNLAIPMCLLMAQQRSGIIITPTSGELDGDQRHLKLIGKLYDQCHDTFVQFASFLSTALSIDEVSKRLPKLDELMTQYFLPSDAAFALSRPLYANQIEKKFDELRKADKKDKEKQTASAKVQRYIEASTHVMNPVIEMLQPLELVRRWDDLTPQFYATFWSLTMTDLQVPVAAYEKQVTQLKQQLIAIEENHELAPSKKKKEKERTISMIEKIQDEEKRQNEHVNRVTARLKHDKDTWFIPKSQKHATVTTILQTCLFPRCCFTAIDAVYSAKFLHILHSLKTPSFSSLICYDRILADITWSMTSCTENEAHRYGRFLCTIFDDIMRWHSDKACFEKECANFPGFKTVFRNAGKDSSNSVADQLDYENYRHLCYKWHYHMTKVFVACMDSGEYLQTRNALIVLTKVLQHYPRITKFVQAMEKRVDKVCQEQKEKRPDLFALAMGYAGQMKMRKKTWVTENDFHQVKRGGTDNSRNDSKTASNKKENTSTKKPESDRKTDDTVNDSDDKKLKDKSDADSSSRKDAKASDSKERRDKDSESSKNSKDSKSKEKKDKKEKKDSRKDKEDRSSSKKDSRMEELIDDHPRSDSKERNKGSKEGNRGREDYSSRESGKDDRSTRTKDDRSRQSGEFSRREKDDRRDEKRRDKEAGNSSGNEHIGLRRSAEPSPRVNDDRESKRRKMDGSSSKERYKVVDVYRAPDSTKSPTHERTDREKDKSRDKGADKAERKRDRSQDDTTADYKRHKSDELSGKSKMNGDSENSAKKHGSSLERIKERDSADNHINKKSPRSRRESPDKSDRERKSEKHGSSKKSKHH